MSAITHHIRAELLAAWVSGNLPAVFAVVVASHVALCEDCQAATEAAQAIGGALLERLTPADLSTDALSRALAALDQPAPPVLAPRAAGIFPAPVMQALGGQPPKWRMLGGGIRQQILMANREGSLRLLYIPPGRKVPEHGHRGLELTLVLQGSFSDSAGHFGLGDVEDADGSVDHQPIAGAGEACICLAATDAPLRFHAMIPRLLQPMFRI